MENQKSLEVENFELKKELAQLKQRLYEAKELCVKRGVDVSRLYNELVLLEARILEYQKPMLLGQEEKPQAEENTVVTQTTPMDNHIPDIPIDNN